MIAFHHYTQVECAGTHLSSVTNKLNQVENLISSGTSDECAEFSVLELLESMTEVNNEYQNLRKDIKEVQQLQKEMTNSLRFQMRTMSQTFQLLKKRIELKTSANWGAIFYYFLQMHLSWRNHKVTMIYFIFCIQGFLWFSVFVTLNLRWTFLFVTLFQFIFRNNFRAYIIEIWKLKKISIISSIRRVNQQWDATNELRCIRNTEWNRAQAAHTSIILYSIYISYYIVVVCFFLFELCLQNACHILRSSKINKNLVPKCLWQKKKPR